jgi:hypothetical protein
VFGKLLAAIGADGQYSRANSFCDVKLSAKDVSKWDVEPGTRVAILGGRSRSSKLIELDEDEAITVSKAMQDNGIEDGRRQLAGLGYDIGESNRIEPIDPKYNPTDPTDRSEAALVQSSIESGDRDPGYEDIFRVSCRLLRLRGWRETVEWIEGIYGDEFDAARTHSHLTTIVEAYPETYDVEAPDAPIDPSAGD